MKATEHDGGGSQEVAEGAKREVTVGGEKLLLSRIAGRCHAIGATCPHAGGPLAEGVIHDGAVICPWHKAAFRLDTGARTEPPAVDDVPCHAVREEGGRILIDAHALPPRVDNVVAHGRTEERCFVVIGAGAAGMAAAQTLREEGFGGRVVLVGREDRLPYDRTLLSKYVLSGQECGEKSPLQDEAFFIRHRIERLSRDVVALDREAQRLTFADGNELDYDAALVATGGVPRRPDIPGANGPNVFVLRSPADALAILAAAATAKRVVALGTGFIGMEAAASLRESGLEVTVVGPESAPFEKQLGPKIGGAFQQLHEQNGVAFRLGQSVARIEPDAVVLERGARLPADFVVVGAGIAPATRLLAGMKLRDDGGVTADARLSIAPGLWAAGDIAAFPLFGDGPSTRVEHWRVAQQHGRVAALNMLGRETRYESVPVFWTIQYMKRLDYVGHAEKWDEIVIDGDLEKPEFIALFVREGRVAAVAGWDRDKQTSAAIGLMTDRKEWPAEELMTALRAV
jgi:NADPH-dependent 2,4-dienoyl-CoA reductase/sulfur reductase-like enzyme/nitrite reductase/ring-hydroxylating ferredoxin subunit